MSTILKALRKVEGERKKDVDARRHHAEVTSTGPGPSAPSAGRSRIVAVAGVGLILAAAGLAWSWLRPVDHRLTEIDPAIRIASPTLAAAPASRQASGFIRESGTAPVSVAAVERKLPPLAPPAPLVPSPAPVVPSPAPVVPDLVEAAVETAGLSASASEGAQQAPPTQAAPPEILGEASARPGPPPISRLVDESAPINPAPTNPAPAKPAPKAKPAPEALAPEPEVQVAVKVPPVAVPVRWPETRPAPAAPAPVVPEIRVLRTLWHPVAEKRIAYVSASAGPSVEIHEGETFQGLEVSEIGLSSVVFEADGQSLTRSVGANE